jgi:hypothetical protein
VTGGPHRAGLCGQHSARRVDGTTQAEVLLNLGREKALDRDGLARLVA